MSKLTPDYIVYTDGSSKGNPGPASFGVVFERDGRPWKTFRQDFGIATNNEAEYEAVIFALKKLKHIVGKKITKASSFEFRADSELMIKQLNHKFKIQEPEIQKRFMQIWNALIDFGSVKFTHVPREQNRVADALANGRQGKLT